VIMYADTITESMQKTIDETARRRSIQLKYNEDHHITPKQIVKDIKGSLPLSDGEDYETPRKPAQTAYIEPETNAAFAADPIINRMTRPELEKSIANTKKLMEEAAKKLDFIQAAQYRDEIVRLQKQLELKN
jgi:excinuclease ABC subunit B